MKQKVFSSLDAAVADIPDGARIMFGGFGGAGFPNNLIEALSPSAGPVLIRYSQASVIAVTLEASIRASGLNRRPE